MKTRYAVAILTMGMSVAALAQENDDMYFNSKDRVVVTKANEIVLAKRYQQDDMNAVRSNPVNPSDSYSGRGVNPEYNAQTKNGTTVVQNSPDYFLSGYQPKGVNGSLYSGGASAYSNPCNCNNSFSNYGMGMGYGGMGYGSMMGMGMGYGSMMGMGMGYGSMMGMGMGMGYGGYSSFYNPYSSFYSPYSMFSMGYGMGGMYSPYSMMGMGYGMYGGYGYPYGGVTVINTGDGRSTVTGRHPSRSSGLNNYVDNGSSRSTSNGSVVGTTGRGNQGGRVSTSSTPNYYDRGWKNNSSNFSNSGDNGGGWNTGNTRSGWGGNGGNSGSNWGNSGGATRSSFDSFGGGSRGSFGGGGGSTGGGGGGGGGGHSRGRN